MTWRPFEALPPYFGGKRRLCKLIFAEIAKCLPPEQWDHSRLVDPFMGGGAVALYGKAQGFEVIAGDIARRCYIIGKALVENNTVAITESDIAMLWQEVPGAPTFIEDHYVPDQFPEHIGKFLDRAFAAAGQFAEETKRALMQLLLVKYVFWLRPYSQFSSPEAFNRPFAEGRVDDIKDSYRHSIEANSTPPWNALRVLSRLINRAIFIGAQPCRIHKRDAQELVEPFDGEVLYLDPPYAGTLSYEKEYQVLDALLGEHLEPSDFSRADGLNILEKLLELAGAYRLWVISYGNELSGLPEVRARVERFRPVRTIEMKYAHLQERATAEKSERNREFLLLAGEGVRT